MKNAIILILAICSLTFAADPQQETLFHEEVDGDYLVVPINISFVPGMSLGESLANGRKIKNRVSFNILGGEADRLEGVEFSGLWGYNRDGFKGAQWAGIINSASANSMGAQWAGIGNIIEGDLLGAQWGGVFNLNDGSLNGAQWAGVFNGVDGDLLGVQAAGIANLLDGRMDGCQAAGVLNISQDMMGVQASGVTNIVAGDMMGLQVAGVVNIAEKVHGTQIAGVVNVAEKVDGFQVGVINVSERNTGIPIGLVSYVENVGLKLELWGDETNFGYAGIRSGTKTFHNILFAGAKNDDSGYWTMGAGLGVQQEFFTNNFLGFDVLHKSIFQNWDWMEDYRSITSLRLNVGFKLNETITIFGGPSINYLLTEANDVSELVDKDFIREKHTDNHWHRFYPSVSVGIRIF